MKVTINRLGGGPISFEDFADTHGLEMVVTERGHDATGTGSQFYAHFKDVEVMERGCLVGAYGNGATPEAAITDYARDLRGKRIAVGAYTSARREIQCPSEWKGTK